MQAVVIDDKIKVRFIQTRNLVYDRDNVIIIPKEGAVKGKEETLLAEVTSLGGVLGASATGHDMTGTTAEPTAPRQLLLRGPVAEELCFPH